VMMDHGDDHDSSSSVLPIDE